MSSGYCRRYGRWSCLGPAGPLTGSGGFVMQPGDVPAEEEPAEPGRDLPPQVMRVLCENLPALEPPEIQVAVQIAIDTGRRPEDICALPLDCLARDKDNLPVLVYDNAKAGRLKAAARQRVHGPGDRSPAAPRPGPGFPQPRRAS